MHVTRAQFLRMTLAGLPVAMVGGATAAWGQSDRDARRARAAAAIAAYDSQGIHRTGTDVDNASGRWLMQEAATAGGEARLEPFRLQRVDVQAAMLRANGREIQGLPFFDGGFTDGIGITGRLGPPRALTEIALVRVDRLGATAGQSMEALRRNAAHRAIVAITDGSTPGLSPSNAEDFATPYGLPVLQVGTEHQEALGALAESGALVTLIARAERTLTTAQNVVVTVAGRQPALAPLVVMTPRSGWWHCASERGGGIACWLEAVRAVAAASPARTVLFVASSGHELGHYGLDAFIGARPGLIKQAAAWIHLGANIGAANGGARLQSSDDEIERLALEAFETAGATIRQRIARGTVPAGEARNIHIGGGRYVSLLGSGPLFHHIADRWPAAVDIDAVVRYAGAVSSVAVSLAR